MPLSAFCLLLSLPSSSVIVPCAMEIIFLICFEVTPLSPPSIFPRKGKVEVELEMEMEEPSPLLTLRCLLCTFRHSIERALSPQFPFGIFNKLASVKLFSFTTKVAQKQLS